MLLLDAFDIICGHRALWINLQIPRQAREYFVVDFTMLEVYFLIKRFIFKSKSRVALFAGKVLESSQQVNHTEEIKITKTMFFVVGSFLFCWLPITIYFLVIAVMKMRVPFDLENLSVGLILLGISITATHFNSAIDPLIYAYRIKEVRDAIQMPFKCRRLVDNELSSRSTE